MLVDEDELDSMTVELTPTEEAPREVVPPIPTPIVVELEGPTPTPWPVVALFSGLLICILLSVALLVI
jgi:hypothetical protein